MLLADDGAPAHRCHSWPCTVAERVSLVVDELSDRVALQRRRCSAAGRGGEGEFGEAATRSRNYQRLGPWALLGQLSTAATRKSGMPEQL